MARDDTNVIVAIHGVGSPAAGEVAQSVCEGYIRAYPTDAITTTPLLLAINPSPNSYTYRGLEVHRADATTQIWEVNWSDLKNLPKGKLGTALYALKAVVAMLQLSDKGWQPEQNGIAGKLISGALLRTYFCAFSLVTPLIMLAIAFA
jgi:hypothetical protein